jgi:hypothetical protein
MGNPRDAGCSPSLPSHGASIRTGPGRFRCRILLCVDQPLVAFQGSQNANATRRLAQAAWGSGLGAVDSAQWIRHRGLGAVDSAQWIRRSGLGAVDSAASACCHSVLSQPGCALRHKRRKPWDLGRLGSAIACWPSVALVQLACARPTSGGQRTRASITFRAGMVYARRQYAQDNVRKRSPPGKGIPCRAVGWHALRT